MATNDGGPAFDPNAWAKQYGNACDEACRNSLLDSGWSASVAEQTAFEQLKLLRELFTQLRQVETKPEDYFDRPQLAAALAAVHSVKFEV